MSAKHSTYRRLILFDVRPRVLPAQRWIRMFLGVIVIVKFMLLWKATIHAFEAAKSFLLRNVFIIFRRRICSLGSARFCQCYCNLVDSLEGSETSGPSLWTSYYYRCYTDDAEHHYIRHKVTDVIDIMTCATCPNPYFLKSTTTHHAKFSGDTPGLSHDPQGGGGNSSRTLIFEIAYSLDACSAGGCATSD